MANYRKRVSMQDIADYVGVSKNAVSLALNNKPGVSDELRKKIIDVAMELGYGDFRKKTKSILVLVPEYISNDSIFYNDIYWSIDREVKLNGYNSVLTSVSQEFEHKLKLPTIYHEMDFAGIILIGVFSEQYVKKIVDTGLPVLSIDHYYDNITIDSVVTANEECAYLAVKHLIDNGHREIGYIGSIEMTASLYDRWCGYKRAMERHGLPVKEEYCILKSSPLKNLLSDVAELEEALNKMDRFPTAWFCGGDRIAIALIQALSKRNISVPDDISVMGFDDLEIARLVVPSLSTVRVRRDLLSFEAVRLMIDKISNKVEGKKISIYGELVIRSSVKALDNGAK